MNVIPDLWTLKEAKTYNFDDDNDVVIIIVHHQKSNPQKGVAGHSFILITQQMRLVGSVLRCFTDTKNDKGRTQNNLYLLGNFS